MAEGGLSDKSTWDTFTVTIWGDSSEDKYVNVVLTQTKEPFFELTFSDDTVVLVSLWCVSMVRIDREAGS